MAASAKQKAAQKRLAAASRKASKEGKKGKAFRARIKQLLKGTGGGGKSKSTSKGKSKSRGGSTAKSNPSPRRAPKIGAQYTAAKRGLKVISPATSEVLRKARVRTRTGTAKIFSEDTLKQIGNKVATGAYAANLGIEILDTVVDRKTAQAGALTRGSVTAIIPEVFTGFVMLDRDIPGGIPAQRAEQMHSAFVETQNAYNVLADQFLVSDNFKNYRLLKHGGQAVRMFVNKTSVGKRIGKPLKQVLKMVDLTI